MIQFEPEVTEPKLLRKAVQWARRNRDHMPRLSDLQPRRSVDDLTAVAKSWQKSGLGRLIEISSEGRREVVFSLNDEAIARVDAEGGRSMRGRLASVPRSDWIALMALVVSILGLFVNG